MLINYSVWEPIGNFFSITAGKIIAWNAAGEAVYGNLFQSLPIDYTALITISTFPVFCDYLY